MPVMTYAHKETLSRHFTCKDVAGYVETFTSARQSNPIYTNDYLAPMLLPDGGMDTVANHMEGRRGALFLLWLQ